MAEKKKLVAPPKVVATPKPATEFVAPPAPAEIPAAETRLFIHKKIQSGYLTTAGLGDMRVVNWQVVPKTQAQLDLLLKHPVLSKAVIEIPASKANAFAQNVLNDGASPNILKCAQAAKGS